MIRWSFGLGFSIPLMSLLNIVGFKPADQAILYAGRGFNLIAAINLSLTNIGTSYLKVGEKEIF
jgi:hypothetical protein